MPEFDCLNLPILPGSFKSRSDMSDIKNIDMVNLIAKLIANLCINSKQFWALEASNLQVSLELGDTVAVCFGRDWLHTV